ncbi:MAG: secretin N-terminal domain-containing protein, partial [Chromatiaceae bacterium]
MLLGLAWAWCLGPAALAREYPLEIIELRSRLPEELIPILTPLAGPDGTVVGAQHALFVRAAPERLADIRRALAELDRPARS